MEIRFGPDDEPAADDGPPGVVERGLLGAVRLLSLPFFILAILIASLFYGFAGVARWAVTVGDRVVGRVRGLSRPWLRSPAARDA